jgi:hypothetical protein
MAKAKTVSKDHVEALLDMVSLTAVEPIKHGVALVAPGEEFFALPIDAAQLIESGAAVLTVAAE